MSKNRNRKRKPINPIPKFAVGDIIKHPHYGVGIIKKIDTALYPNYEFFYYADFPAKGGDGTKVWLPKVKTEKTCSPVNGESVA